MGLRVRRLASLSAREWTDLLRAQWRLVRAAWRVRRAPIGALAIRESFETDMLGGDPARAEEIAQAVRRAAEHGLIRPKCLVRSIALRDALARAGVSGASIRIGVRRRAGNFEAHAWVRWGDRVVGDDPRHVAQFTEVDDLRVIERA